MHIIVKLIIIGIVICLYGEAGRTGSSGGRRPKPLRITFIGDSILRYQYLSFVYAIHYKTPHPPNFIVREKLFDNWTEFYENTTYIFGSAMVCDCYREDDYLNTRENRYYTSPDGTLKITYLQKFGDHTTRGFEIDKAQENFNTLHSTNYWEDHLWEDLLLHRIKHTDILIMSAGHHGCDILLDHIEKVFRRALKVANIVIWQQITPPRWEITGSNVNTRDIDVVVRDHICTTSKRNMRRREHLSWCTYIPFPFTSLAPTDYWDGIHFSQTSIYAALSHAALTMAGVCPSHHSLCDYLQPALPAP